MVTVGASYTSTTTGTWTLFPGQGTLYTSAVQQPINTDGSSVFNANRGVIPVKFALYGQPGPVQFQSIGSDSNTDNDFSFLSFTPTTPFNFEDLTDLAINYAFTIGTNHGGSIRWSVRIDRNDNGIVDDGSLFIYYGPHPNFNSDAPSLSNANLVGNTDLRFDTSQYPGGTFYDSYANVLAAYGTKTVLRASVVLDGGWGGDQVVNLMGATVNGNTWVPATGGLTPISDLPDAEIMVTKTAGSGSGVINEPLTIQPSDNDGMFRKVDSKYMYNLDVRSLLGAGTYEVRVMIDGVPASGPAIFKLQ